MASNNQAQVPEQDQASQSNAMAEPISERPVANDVPYSVFPVWQKKMIVLGVALAAVFSPMSTVGHIDSINVTSYIRAVASDASASNCVHQKDDAVKSFF